MEILNEEVVNLGISQGYNMEYFLSYLKYRSQFLEENDLTYEKFQIMHPELKDDCASLMAFCHEIGIVDIYHIPPYYSYKRYCLANCLNPYFREPTSLYHEIRGENHSLIMATADNKRRIGIIKNMQRDSYFVEVYDISDTRSKLSGVVFQSDKQDKLESILALLHEQTGDISFISGYTIFGFIKDAHGYTIMIKSIILENVDNMYFLPKELKAQNFLKTAYNILHEQYTSDPTIKEKVILISPNKE